MTCYKPSMLEEECGSNGSIHLSEGVSSTATHIRYHNGPPETCFVEFPDRKRRHSTDLRPFPTWRLKKWMSFEQKHAWYLGSIIAVIGTTYVIYLIASSGGGSSVSVEKKLCLTEKCVHTASNLLSSINHKINPCQNFYEFACGKWVLSNPVPDGRPTWGMFHMLEQKNQLIIKNVLERENFEKTEPEAEQKVKRYYMSCLDVNETTEALGATPMLNLITELGNWSLTDENFDITTWDFQPTLELLQNEYGLGGLFYWTVSQDDKNSSAYVIQLDQPGLTLPSSENYKNITNNTKLFQAYLDYMTTTITLLGAEENSTRTQMNDVILFESQLSLFMTPDEYRRDGEKNYHKYTIAELQKKANFLNWMQYFKDAFRKTNHTVTENQVVVVYALDYINNLSSYIVGNTDQRTKLTIHNYLMWQAVRSMSSYLSKQFRDAYKGLRKVIYGTDGSIETWRFCVSDTNNVLGFALGALYVRETFHGPAKHIAKDMINNIRKAFVDNFDKLHWMDSETSNLAKEKADAIVDMIGYPDYILNNKQLNEKYNGLDIRENEYFQNNLRLNKFRIIEALKRIDDAVNKSSWLMTPSTVNAYYSPNSNRIVFPAGILQFPFYDQEQSLALNYGGIGVVMGHELTHAFDDQGREYDKFGNLNQWWKNSTVKRFKRQTECIKNQYSNFSLNGKNVNGLRTLGENIADNGGLKASYHAYLKLKYNNVELTLPGVNFTSDQLFFISFAQGWCSASTDESLELQIDKDMHAPSVFRVNGPVMNLKEFSDVFRCPVNTAMNPTKKCEVW